MQVLLGKITHGYTTITVLLDVLLQLQASMAVHTKVSEKQCPCLHLQSSIHKYTYITAHRCLHIVLNMNGLLQKQSASTDVLVYPSSYLCLVWLEHPLFFCSSIAVCASAMVHPCVWVKYYIHWASVRVHLWTLLFTHMLLYSHMNKHILDHHCVLH